MNRDDFRKLARLRLREARLLLKGGLHEGAYYLAGYAVECALKACYAKRTRRFDFPPEKQEYSKVYSHDLAGLATIAGVRGYLEEAPFSGNWKTVQDWQETSRYRFVSRKDADELIVAITDRKDGVFTCIQRHW